MHACFHSIHINYLCEIVWNCSMHNKCMSLYGNFTNYRISLVLWAPSSLKTVLKESPPAQAKHVQRTVEFGGKLLQIRGSPCCGLTKRTLWANGIWFSISLQREIQSVYKEPTLISYIFCPEQNSWSCITHFQACTSCLACQHFDFYSTNWFSDNLHMSSI